MFPTADKLYGDADFIFQQDLASAHTAKGAKSWFNDHGYCVTVLDRHIYIIYGYRYIIYGLLSRGR